MNNFIMSSEEMLQRGKSSRYDIVRNMEMTWRSRLSCILEERKISRREFARQIGKSDTYIIKLLSTEHEPSISIIVSMADALNVSLGYLLYGVEDSPELEMFARQFVKLSATQKRAVEAIMDSMLETPHEN